MNYYKQKYLQEIEDDKIRHRNPAVKKVWEQYQMLLELNSDKEIFTRLEEKTAYLERGIHKVLSENNIEFTINRVGSMISVHFDKNEVYDFETAKNGDNERFKKFFHELLNCGDN